jgi:hypothetical protein
MKPKQNTFVMRNQNTHTNDGLEQLQTVLPFL